jgi:plastocyanin
MKVIATTLAGLALGATGILGVASAAGSSLPRTATVQIRHQTAGCHSWSVNGGPVKAAQSLKLARGAQVTITDNDVMSHQLVRLSGPRVTYTLTKPGMPMAGGLKAPYASGLMPHMGATLRVTFAKKGVYTFKTTAGEDYMKGIKTTGEDNVLKLIVTVS